jgi:hypothetical protein
MNHDTPFDNPANSSDFKPITLSVPPAATSVYVTHMMDRNAILAELKRTYIHGHPEFVSITLDELDLHDRKNMDYAGLAESPIHSNDPMGNFNRVSSILAHYPKLNLSNPIVVALVYMFKQLDCILWSLSQDRDTKVDTLDERFADVHVYAKLARCMWRDMLKNKKG